MRSFSIKNITTRLNIYAHDGGFPCPVPSQKASHFPLAEFQSEVIYRHDIALVGVVDLLHALESHPRLLLVHR